MAERVAWADAARTLACGLVVLVHVNIYTRAGLETWWPFGFAGMPLFCIAVPAFMILAGYFAPSAAENTGPAPEASSRRMLRLLVPFLAWNVLTLGALCAEGLRPDAAEVVLQILTGTWQLYFIFALLQLLVIHRLVHGRADPPALAVAAGTTVAVYALGDLLLWRLEGADNGAFETLSEKLFLSWTAFFFVGLRLRRRPEIFERIERQKGAALLVLAASYALFLFVLDLEVRRFGYNPRKQVLLGGLPFHVVGAILLLAALRALDRSGRGRAPLAWLAAAATDTYGIYLSHTAVLIGVFAAARTLGWTTYRGIETPLLAIATWIISLALVTSARRFAPGWLKFAVLGERASGPAASA